MKVTYSARFVEDAFLDRESETIEGSFILYTDGFVQTTDSIWDSGRRIMGGL